tara:strand:+ start:668 stop:1015 length:348 start_codon:yes stop_codon:yes gene_type:complete
MARKEHLRRQNLRNVQGVPQDQEDIALELQKEFNGLDRFDEDIPRANNVIDVSEPSDERIKDIEGKVDKNQFGTIELYAGSPRKLLDISLTTEKVQLTSLRRVVDLEFEHFKLKG